MVSAILNPELTGEAKAKKKEKKKKKKKKKDFEKLTSMGNFNARDKKRTLRRPAFKTPLLPKKSCKFIFEEILKIFFFFFFF